MSVAFTVNTAMFVCLVYCPSDFTHDNDSGTCLKLVTDQVVWSEANTGCHSEHTRAHLVVINDNDKQETVEDFIDSEHITSYFDCLG